MLRESTELVLYDPDEVRKTISLIPSGLFEIRALNARRQCDSKPVTLSGVFDNADDALAALDTIVDATGIYVTLNPLLSELRPVNNTLEPAKRGEATSKDQIRKREWLFIDFDPQRPKHSSSTDSEHHRSFFASAEVVSHLSERGWPSPLRCHSGNGTHLLYKIDLPNTPDSQKLIRDALQALSQQFSTATVEIDTATHDANRITKLYGTRACKGEPSDDRPHRLSRITSAPDVLETVTESMLNDLVGEHPVEVRQDVFENAEQLADPSSPWGDFNVRGQAEIDQRLLVNGFQRDQSFNDPTGKEFRYIRPGKDQGEGHGLTLRWIDENGRWCLHCFTDSSGTFEADGNYTLSDTLKHLCFGGNWPETEDEIRRMGYGDQPTVHSSDDNTTKKPNRELPIITPSPQLVRDYPTLNAPLIHGLLRRQETANIVAPTKLGKSWFVHQLAISLATGSDFLGFGVEKSSVLLIDNELHKNTLADRIRKVAKALRTAEPDNLAICSLRGDVRDIHGLAEFFLSVETGQFDVLILDALYRFVPDGKSESDNNAMTMLYNAIDGHAKRLNAAFINIVHTSKGDQSTKAVTDLGSGAGAISRAVDSHITLRPHELADMAVLEAAVRSFPPVEPSSIKWDFPVWTTKDGIEPQIKMQKSHGDRKQAKKDDEGKAILAKWIGTGKRTTYYLNKKLGGGMDRTNRLLGLMRDIDGTVEEHEPPEDSKAKALFVLTDIGLEAYGPVVPTVSPKGEQ